MLNLQVQQIKFFSSAVQVAAAQAAIRSILHVFQLLLSCEFANFRTEFKRKDKMPELRRLIMSSI